MGNCLKTQLKETVQNDSLHILGIIKIHVNATNNDGVDVRSIRLAFLENTTIYTSGNYLYEYGSDTSQQSITIPANTLTSITFGIGEYDVYIPKYKLFRIKNVENDILLPKAYSIDMSQFDNVNIGELYLVATPLSNIVKLYPSDYVEYTTYVSGITNLDNNYVDIKPYAGKNAILIGITCKHLIGNINYLSGVSETIYLESNENALTGDLTEFVNNQIAKGITNATYTFKVAQTNATLKDNGNPFTNIYVESQGGVGKAIGVKFIISNGVVTKEWL